MQTCYSSFDVERENRILDANNLGAFYRFVNSKLGNSSGIGPLHDKDGNLLFDDKAKAELLNQYFIQFSSLTMAISLTSPPDLNSLHKT